MKLNKKEKPIQFNLNNEIITYSGDLNYSLLNYLRNIEGITSVKDGCSGQAACGACMVELDGKAVLACVTKMGKLDGSNIVTIEGFPTELKDFLAKAFVSKGAVQCGFCSPGFLTRTKILLENNPNANREEIIKALRFNICRCTGYIKIIEAIETVRDSLNSNKKIDLNKVAGIGNKYPKYRAYEKAIGTNPFVDDLKFGNMLYAVLKFSDHPRAKVLNIDISDAENSNGVKKVFTGKDVPGKRLTGLIKKDWPLMVVEGETTRYIGDVIAGVVADTEENARKAAELIKVDYEVLEPLTDMLKAEESSIIIDPSGNLLEDTIVKRGEPIEQVLENSMYVSKGTYQTQRVEHAFLETEAAIALPWGDDGIELFSQGQGVYEDRISVASILALPEKKVKVTLIPNGGGFGGKEDLTVQGHVSLFSYILKEPVKLHLRREESIRMHPKRHPFHMKFSVGCDKDGMLTGIKAKITGDTGAYASVGMKVLERAAGHATGAYNVPNVDLSAKAFYTNNIPCGAMRGFGVNQVVFAIEGCIDELCEKGGFDRWQFRYDNALINGSKTATGQILKEAVGVRKTLLAVKDLFYKTKYAGLACGIKNCGVGNGMSDYSEVKIQVSNNRVIIHHGWTEMGQGVNTVAIQTLYEETGIDPSIMRVKVSTENEARSGMTTSSRGTSLVGNAIIKAAEELKKDLKKKSLDELSGKTYFGRWSFDDSTKPGAKGEVITHYSYSYATQLVSLDDNGNIDTVYAAHDAGKIMNRTLFEGQIQGAVHMGLGYALSENLPMEKGFLKSTRYRDLGLLSIADMPKVVVMGVEEEDPLGPYGAKGVGEIGLVPTAGALCNALYQFDGKRRFILPVNKNKD